VITALSMRDNRSEFRDFSCDFVDRPSAEKDTIHEFTQKPHEKKL
jgi:hypothetical protein